MLSMTNLKNHRWKCVLVDLIPSSHIYCLLPSTPIFKNTTVIPGLRLQYTVGLWIKAWVHTHGARCNSIQLYLKGLFGTVWRHWQSDHKALHTIAQYSMTHIQLFHLANTHSPYQCITATLQTVCNEHILHSCDVCHLRDKTRAMHPP